MSNFKCPYCGKELFDWEDSSGYYTCPNCAKDFWDEESGVFFCDDTDEYFDVMGNELVLNDDRTDEYQYDDFETYSEEKEEVPPGCKECGGDYPNCVSGCNLWDD